VHHVLSEGPSAPPYGVFHCRTSPLGMQTASDLISTAKASICWFIRGMSSPTKQKVRGLFAKFIESQADQFKARAKLAAYAVTGTSLCVLCFGLNECRIDMHTCMVGRWTDARLYVHIVEGVYLWKVQIVYIVLAFVYCTQAYRASHSQMRLKDG
jgi:hypothetical protein